MDEILKSLFQVSYLEAKRTAEAVALEGKHLYDSGEINGDDLHKILLAIESIFSYLNNRYTKISSLNEEVYKMAKTLYDPAVEQRGIEKGIEKAALAALKKGLDLDTIKEITGLDMNRLLELQKSLPR